jgi:hypothetical protein
MNRFLVDLWDRERRSMSNRSPTPPTIKLGAVIAKSDPLSVRLRSTPGRKYPRRMGRSVDVCDQWNFVALIRLPELVELLSGWLMRSRPSARRASAALIRATSSSVKSRRPGT